MIFPTTSDQLFKFRDTEWVQGLPATILSHTASSETCIVSHQWTTAHLSRPSAAAVSVALAHFAK